MSDAAHTQCECIWAVQQDQMSNGCKGAAWSCLCDPVVLHVRCLSLRFLSQWHSHNNLTLKTLCLPLRLPLLNRKQWSSLLFLPAPWLVITPESHSAVARFCQKWASRLRHISMIPWEMTDSYYTLIWQGGTKWCKTSAPPSQSWCQVVFFLAWCYC